jgi:hypothetical protein
MLSIAKLLFTILTAKNSSCRICDALAFILTNDVYVCWMYYRIELSNFKKTLIVRVIAQRAIELLAEEFEKLMNDHKQMACLWCRNWKL